MTILWSGNLKKMRVQATTPATYWLAGFEPLPPPPGQRSAGGITPVTNAGPALNDLLGRAVTVRFAGRINCVACGREIKKSFGEGFCFPCSQARAEADICMVKPELCHYFEPDNPCREEAWAQGNCFQPHVLYAALTSGLKIGITRKINVPSRWLDQGAVAAIPLAELPSRREVGLIERALAQRFADKTHWMRMLRQQDPEGDLTAFSTQVLEALAVLGGVAPLPPEERVLHRFTYPVASYPQKIRSWNLDKSAEVSGTVLGIKGQYLILDTGVINIRSHTGYAVTVGA